MEEVVEPGPEDVDIRIGGALLHLLGDEREAFTMLFEGQETGQAVGGEQMCLVCLVRGAGRRR